MYKITTSTGSVYQVDTDQGLWKKNDDPWERIWALNAVSPDLFGKGLTRDEILEQSTQDTIPQPGEHLYVASRDVWWMSTSVTSVEEIDD